MLNNLIKMAILSFYLEKNKKLFSTKLQAVRARYNNSLSVYNSQTDPGEGSWQPHLQFMDFSLPVLSRNFLICF